MTLFHRAKLRVARGGSLEELTQQIGRELLENVAPAHEGIFLLAILVRQTDGLGDRQRSIQGAVVSVGRCVSRAENAGADSRASGGLSFAAGCGTAQGDVAGTEGGRCFQRDAGVDDRSADSCDGGEIYRRHGRGGALPRLRELWDRGMGFSVDLLGEACLSDVEAAAYQKRYLDLISHLPAQIASWPANATLESDHLGSIPRANVSIKISSLYARTKAVDTEGSIRGLLDALQPILESAKANNVLINFDMEQHELKDLTIALFERACERFDFPAGVAIQAYLRSGEEDARRLIDWAKRTGKQIAVRLIKGAYWDYETIHAEEKGWPAPVWKHKYETDACFERMTELFVRRDSDQTR